jgi:dTDP-4-amino-4,6-dideoxygalactose transaminase
MSPTPKLPVLATDTFSGAQQAEIPCILNQSTAHYTISGRAAILLALETLQIHAGDKVWVPTYHCPTMVAPVVAMGAQPVFYPIDSHGAPDLQWIDKHFETGARAMLVAHLFGLPQPLAHIRQWCNQHDVHLIEDCAHALFGSTDTGPIGSTGDLAIASLTKFLPVPEGGCLVNNLAAPVAPSMQAPSLTTQIKAAYDIVDISVNFGHLPLLAPVLRAAEGLRKLLKPHATPAESSAAPDAPNADGFTIDTVKSHMALTAACSWMAQHAHRARIVARRRDNYLFFVKALAGVPGMRPLLPQMPDQCAPYVFPLWVDTPDPGYAELRRIEYPVSRWDWRWPTVPQIQDDQGTLWSHHVLQLACHQDLTDDERHSMVTTLKRVYAA